jgi:hypothetical protein
MTSYIEWNSLLLEEYFSPSNAFQDVWVATNRLELEGIGVHLGGANGLIEAVKEGPPWPHESGHIGIKAAELARQRRASSDFRPIDYIDPERDSSAYQGAKAPTYLPYIALWVLAGSEGRDSFYQKVSELIEESFPNSARKTMEAVWQDLENWSILQEKRRFGSFKLSVLGAHRFVGMAYAQALVTIKDIEGITRLFGSCRLHSGQVLEDSHFAQLLEHGRHSHYLSSGLRRAMEDEEYNDHLRQVLSSHLDLWDGYIPKRKYSSGGGSKGQVGDLEEFSEEIEIILRIRTDSENPCWEVGWRVPAIETAQNYKIKVGDANAAEAKLEFSGTHIHSISFVNQSDARRALNQSAIEDVGSVLVCETSDGDLSERKTHLRQDKIRVLIWDKPDPALSDSLIEREMPIAGPSYLLYSRSEYSNLESLLTNEEVNYELVDDIDGLPDQWGLICILDTSKLNAEQRATILDEEPANLSKARIRLVGGKPIVGAGSKKYAYYDLPIVELDAPAETVLTCSGLTFEEFDDFQNTEELHDTRNIRIRRFKFSLNDGAGYVFKLKALYENEELCTAGLQVLAAGGLGTARAGQFSLDRYGRALADNSGLCGALIGDTEIAEHDINFFQVAKQLLSDWSGSGGLECMDSNISSLFLDSIATTINGFMSYGVARDQIRRLASNIGIDNIEPALLIRDLRRRGHVEIKTDVKGHMVGVCVVPPALYSLPIVDSEQGQLYGVCGSLRLQQWKELAQATDCKVFVESEESNNLPVTRIFANTKSVIKAIAESANFLVIDLPAQSVSQWLGSVHEIKDKLSWYQEQGLEPKYLERLNPGNSYFRPAEHLYVDPNRTFELFRFEDQQIQGLRVYKLGKNLGHGIPEYSFVADSRWGVWMAVNAFAEFIKAPPFAIADASPWPIHYDSVTGCLWLPARMEPPFVIERALTLCSGSGPVVKQASGEDVEDSILLLEKGRTPIGRVSRVYSEMANGKWLCYRWVPEAIANHAASLLGGELRDI